MGIANISELQKTLNPQLIPNLTAFFNFRFALQVLRLGASATRPALGSQNFAIESAGLIGSYGLASWSNGTRDYKTINPYLRTGC